MEVPHLVEPGWHDLMAAADAPEGRPVRTGGAVHVLAGRCRHMSGPLPDSELTDGLPARCWLSRAG